MKKRELQWTMPMTAPPTAPHLDRWRQIARKFCSMPAAVPLWNEDDVCRAIAEAVAEERKDAERYRWLRANRMDDSDEACDAVNALDCSDEAAMDASIDAAMSQQPAPDEGAR